MARWFLTRQKNRRKDTDTDVAGTRSARVKSIREGTQGGVTEQKCPSGIPEPEWKTNAGILVAKSEALGTLAL
jgi:hypothetical protein